MKRVPDQGRPRAPGLSSWPWPIALAGLLLAGCSTSPFLYSPQRAARLMQAQRPWQAVQALEGIDTGPRGKPVALVVWFNPQCPECARQFQALEPYLPTLHIHWVPVGSRQKGLSTGGHCRSIPASLELAANLLGQVHAARALRINESRFDFARCHGGYAVHTRAPGWAVRAVSFNTKALMRLRVYGTPALFYPTSAGLARHSGKVAGRELAGIVARARAAAGMPDPTL